MRLGTFWKVDLSGTIIVRNVKLRYTERAAVQRVGFVDYMSATNSNSLAVQHEKPSPNETGLLIHRVGCEDAVTLCDVANELQDLRRRVIPCRLQLARVGRAN